MKRNAKLYLQLFVSTFMLSAFTVGGGFVIVPLMRKKFVEGYHWIKEEDMLDLTAIAQSSPGVIAVNAAILIGYQVGGIIGSMITILGTVLPPFIILSVISVAYTAFRDSLIVHYVLLGMQAGVAAVILDVVLSMIKELLKERKLLPVIVMIGAFIATFFFTVNVAYVVLISGFIGGLTTLYLKYMKKNGERE